MKYFPRSHLGAPSSVLGAAQPGGERKTPVHHGAAGLGEIILSSASGQRQGSVLWARFTRQLFVFKRPADLSHYSAQHSHYIFTISRDDARNVVGFVYYEVDCFWFLKNPYIPLDVSEPTMAVESQNDLVGDGREERQEAVGKYEAVHEKEELTEDDKGGRGIQV